VLISGSLLARAINLVAGVIENRDPGPATGDPQQRRHTVISWLSKQLITRVMAANREGDIRPTLLLDAPDVSFTFPGANSWSGEFNGKDAHRQWLERLVRVGVKTEPDEVVAQGWPWNTTVCIRGRSWWDSPSGERVYSNRFVIWGKLKWGRLKIYEVYEDTDKANALDAYLEEHEPTLAPA
jgi:ketosteroid isomerase-like protein